MQLALLNTVYANTSSVSSNVQQSGIQTYLAWKRDPALINIIRYLVALSNQVTHELQVMRYKVYTMLKVVGHQNVVFPSITQRQRPVQ